MTTKSPTAPDPDGRIRVHDARDHITAMGKRSENRRKQRREKNQRRWPGARRGKAACGMNANGFGVQQCRQQSRSRRRP